MLSRLLACFALVTGFAAVAAPVNASEVGAMTCQIDASAEQNSASAVETQAHHALPGKSARDQSRDSLLPAQQSEIPAQPTILIGIDRAYE